VQCDLVVFRQEVLLEEHMSQMVLASCQDKSVKQICEALVVDKVCTDAQLLELTLWVSDNTIDDGGQTCDSDPVVTNIEEVQGLVLLEGISKRSCAIDIYDVPVQVQRLQSGVNLERSTKVLDA